MRQRIRQFGEHIFSGQFLASAQEGKINWYLLLYAGVLHLGVVGLCDLFFHSSFVEQSHFTSDIDYWFRWGYVLAIPYFVLLPPAWISWRKKRFERPMTFLLLGYLGATHAFLIYVFGVLSSPLLLIFTSDIAIAFVLYRNQAISFFVLGWGNLLVGVLAVLSVYSRLPYAPVFSGTPYEVRLSHEAFAVFFVVVAAESGLLFWATFYAERARAHLAETATLLDRTSQSLSRAEGEASLGRRLSTVAHELRNPLAAARSILESTLEALEKGGGKLDEEDMGDLKLALQEQKRAIDLVGSLRNLARESGAPAEQVDLNAAVSDAARVLVALRVPGQAGVRTQLHPEPLHFQGNHAETMQVILNLTRNAIDATPDGRPVTLRTARDGEGCVFVECEDQGMGIPEELRERIFEPLFTTKEVGKGTGLGLSHSHELVSRRSGRLELVRSEPGRGATFRVSFPGTPPA